MGYGGAVRAGLLYDSMSAYVYSSVMKQRNLEVVDGCIQEA